MNEHPTHDGRAPEPDPAELARLELASAYVDGDVDEVQRAEVEASPQLMDIVAALRQVRAEVADLPPVDEVARRRAFAAALAEFDAITDGGSAGAGADTVLVAAAAAPVVAPPRNVVSLQSHRRWTRVLGVAAAVVGLGVVGLVAVNGISGGSDSKSSSGAPVPADATSTAGGAKAPGGGSPSTIGSIGGPASARTEVDTPAQLRSVSDQYAVADGGAGNGASTTAASAGTMESQATTAPSTSAGATPPTTTAGSEAAPAVSTPSTGPIATPVFRADRPTLPCNLSSTQIVIALIQYRGVDAAAVLDTANSTISAIDAQCNVLATVHR